MHESNQKSDLPALATPEQETALLLELCEAQIDSALRDSGRSVEVLTNVFLQLIAAVDALGEMAKKIAPPEHMRPDAPPVAPAEIEAAAAITERCGSLTEQIDSAVVAFQFYDKLTQRLDHVRHSLTTLALFVCDRERSTSGDQWNKLRTSLRRLYRTSEERKVFEKIAGETHAGESIAQESYAEQGSVELF
jgi:hypothetical protein